MYLGEASRTFETHIRNRIKTLPDWSIRSASALVVDTCGCPGWVMMALLHQQQVNFLGWGDFLFTYFAIYMFKI
jgi:hypothetical protein